MTEILTVVADMQEAQAAMKRGIEATQTKGELGRAVKETTLELHAYVREIVHVWTGTLKASQYMRFVGNATGEIYTNPNNRNPRTGNSPAEYNYYEFGRGGDHDTYGRTVATRGPSAANKALVRIEEAMGD